MSKVIGPILLLALVADVRGCTCDPAVSTSMTGRECSLTRIAVEEPGDPPVFFIRDANPSKPDRMLAIPHSLRHTLDDLTPDERNALWTAVIEKARTLWNDRWAVAINSEEKRTQCQLHVHIGKLLDDVSAGGGVLVGRVEDIPLPAKGNGLWIQPEGNSFRVHLNEPAGELNLMR